MDWGVDELVVAICESGVDRSRIEEVGRALRTTVGADTLYAHTRSTRTGEPHEAFILQGISEEALTTYAKQFWRTNPVTPYMMAAPLDVVCNLDTIAPGRALQRSALYHEWAFPNGFIRNLGWRGYVSPSLLLSVSVARGERREFGEGELATLRRVAPHFSNAARLRHELQRANEQASTLGELAGSLQCAAFLLDERGRVDAVNDRGRDILRDGRLLRFEDARVRAVERRADDALRRAIAAKPSNRILYLGRPGVMTMLAFVLPRRDGNGTHRPGCLLLVPPGRADSGAVGAWLRRWHDLTPVEAEVAVAIGWGESPEAIAERRGVAITTVRSQLKAVMQKLDVRRRGELVHFVRRAVGPLGHLGPN